MVMEAVGGKAWALIVISGRRQYGGNTGYEDDLAKVYRYDSDVSNSRRLSRGDVVLLRDPLKLLGVARVEQVTSGQGSKRRLRCPKCRKTEIKERITKKPHWRCYRCYHEFDVPVEEEVVVTRYKARFGETFRRPQTEIGVSEIKKVALRPNDQLSIEELDPDRLVQAIGSKVPYLADLIRDSAQVRSLDPEDADEHDNKALDGNLPPIEHRERILTSIRIRRGQQKFRKQLIRRYDARCMISGCDLIDILEAAHIWPYRHFTNNRPDNGLLLRADLHTLFDLNHMGINPATLHVHFSTDALKAGYEQFHGSKMDVRSTRGPSYEALTHRWNAFLDRSAPSRRLVSEV